MSHRRKGAVAALALLVMSFVGIAFAPSSEAQALSADEQNLLSQTNALRAAQGVGPLQINADAQALAEQWSYDMASGAGLKHPQDQWAGISTPVYWVGDDIANGPSVDDVFQQFANSAVHRANLLDPRFDLVGIGVTVVDGVYWTQIKFMASSPQTDAPSDSGDQNAAPPPAAPTDSVDATPTAPDVVVLGETLTKGVNMAVIPPIRYGAIGLPAATVAPATSSHFPVIALGIGIGLLLLVIAALVLESRRRAAKP